MSLHQRVIETQEPPVRRIWGEIVTEDKTISRFTPLGVIHVVLLIDFFGLTVYAAFTLNGAFSFSWKWVTLGWGVVTVLLTGMHWLLHSFYLSATRTPSRSRGEDIAHPKHFPGLPLLRRLYQAVFFQTFAVLIIASVLASFLIVAGGFDKAEAADRVAQVADILIIMLTGIVTCHTLATAISAQARPLTAVQEQAIRVAPRGNASRVR